MYIPEKNPAKSNQMESKRDIQCVLGSVLYTVISLRAQFLVSSFHT